MIYSVKSDRISVSVDSFGCSLHSFFDIEKGEELLWQKNPAVWDCQDILIFPVIDEPYFGIGGKTYRCFSKHGFIRNVGFELKYKTENSMILSACSSDETLKQFPYEFEINAAFSVSGKSFGASYEIVNLSKNTMPFYFGLHPAFIAKDAEARVVFENECEPTLHLLRNKRVFSFRKLKKGKTLDLSGRVFDELKTVILSDTDNVKFRFETYGRKYDIECDSPVLAFWSRTGGDYICIEPWWGMADSEDQPFELSQRKFVNLVDGAKAFSWKITVGDG